MTSFCYNKGCQKEFDESNNPEDACQFHPGVPVFHDAMKGWSCCEKKSTDFTECLNIPGCTYGPHSSVKPVVAPPKEKSVEVIPVPQRKLNPIQKPEERPPDDEPKKVLKAIIGVSLKQALEKKLENLNIQHDPSAGDGSQEITIGTACKNSACRTTYQGEASNKEPCVHHHGGPVFHEGMKYWSCCRRKTSDFDNFLNQEGCVTGNHIWKKAANPDEKKDCRFDWHQTGSTVCISVFSKVPEPEQTYVETNQVACNIYIVYEGQNVFEKKIILKGVIDPDRSNVKLLGTKVEIVLKKADASHWSGLELFQ